MENMENKEAVQAEQTEQTEQTTQPVPQAQKKEDTTMDPVVIFGGIAMLVIGAMMVGKGFIVFVPALGFLRGLFFSLVGLGVMAGGVFFASMPYRRKKKERAEQEAAERK